MNGGSSLLWNRGNSAAWCWRLFPWVVGSTVLAVLLAGVAAAVMDLGGERGRALMLMVGCLGGSVAWGLLAGTFLPGVLQCTKLTWRGEARVTALVGVVYYGLLSVFAGYGLFVSIWELVRFTALFCNG
jgi:hypothetical protein